MPIVLSRLARIQRVLAAALAMGLGLAGAAKAQPQAPPLETYLLTEERLVQYILTAVDMTAEQFALLERYGVPMLAPDPMAALAAAGGGADAAALLARFGFADAAELDALGEAVFQAQTFIVDPEYWALMMGTQLPPAQNVELVRAHLPELTTVAPGIMLLIDPDPTPGPAWATDPYPLTPNIVAAFAATQPLLDPPIQAILERNGIVPEDVDPAPMVAALAAAGALAEVNAILAQYNYASLEEWYSINLAIAQAFGWVIFAEAGQEARFGLAPPPAANVMAVVPYFDAVAALGIYGFTLPGP